MDVNNAHTISDLQKIALRQNAVYIPNADTSFSKLICGHRAVITRHQSHHFCL